MTCAALSGVDGQSDWSSAVESPYPLPAAPPLGAAHCAVLTERESLGWGPQVNRATASCGAHVERRPYDSLTRSVSTATGGDQ